MSYTQEEMAWIAISQASGMTPRRFYRLLSAAGDLAPVMQEPRAWQGAVESKVFAHLAEACREERVSQLFERMEELSIRAVARCSTDYPEALEHISDPPPVLFVRGSLDLGPEKALAIVGTRRPTYDGKKSAARFARELSENGVCVVSGLARGIDTLSHSACLDAGGRTIAVLGNGLSSVYPPENASLAQRIVDQGGSIVSELPLDEAPSRWSFPARNRIIAGLCRAVLVVEGDARSGSMITASCALEQGRDVFAIPGSIYNPLAEGTNRLIQNGAYPALSPRDILEYLRWDALSPAPNKEITPPELDESEKKIYDLLKNEALSFEELVQAGGFDPDELNSSLTLMTLRSIIVRLPGNQYRIA